MKFPRTSGLLLHPTSLPGPFGIGELGPDAYRFADFLAATGQRIWQILPLGPSGKGDSPYACFSAFAGNLLLVSIETLLEESLLAPSDLKDLPHFPEHEVDYDRVTPVKYDLLARAYERFKVQASSREKANFERFCSENAEWLDDYARFMAIREAHDGAVWNEWDKDIALRKPAALKHWSERLADPILSRKFNQYVFRKQWRALREHCNRRGIRIVGDIPIFIAFESSDVWAHPELFHLDEARNPTVVAGVPPDYFCETGQRWGNPLYNWEVMARTGFRWWVDRVRTTLSLVDVVRLDHFRGFEACWSVPASEPTAEHGEWVKAPGTELFQAIQKEIGELPMIAENLGEITPEVEELRHRFGLPGMAVLQFAFGKDPQATQFRPHNFCRELVAYTGTHDNDTTIGWWNEDGSGAGSTRTAEQVAIERENAMRYLNTDGRDVHWAFIRAVYGSVADMAIVPLQDVMGLDNSARMNLPGRPTGNWRWRFNWSMITPEMTNRLAEITRLYER